MVKNQGKWTLTSAEKEKYISALTPELVVLRTKAEISQEELAELIGISRQTYGAIERKVRQMSWSTYLALIMFYDYNHKTHRLIREIGAFPYDIILLFNEDTDLSRLELESFVGDNLNTFITCLDDQAKLSIRTMIMVEYARCSEKHKHTNKTL